MTVGGLTGLLSYQEPDPAREVEPVPADWDPINVQATTALDPAAAAETGPAEESPAFSTARAPARRVEELIIALATFRRGLTGLAYSLPVPGADLAARVALTLADQIDDYLIPRLRQLDAPILAVIGGSTGAGKSTLVNSLLGAPVTKAGVLRPTTRDPVLIAHPDDVRWFAEEELLPRLRRVRGHVADADPVDEQSLEVVAAPGQAPGIALLDAPDVDSVVVANRTLAEELLGAADLWLFVTTAARYADAVPWQALREATSRGAAVALVLDRVPAEAAEEIADHFGQMLAHQQIAQPPLFVVPESILDDRGLLPEEVVQPIREWLRRIGQDPGRRAAIARQTLLGAASSVGPRAELLAAAAVNQLTAAEALTALAQDAYDRALTTVERALLSGALVRGEVLLRWRELAERDELRSALRALSGDWREKVTSTLSNRPPPGRKFLSALGGALTASITDAVAAAAENAHATWRELPTGSALLRSDDVLSGPGPKLRERARALVAEWETWVLDGARGARLDPDGEVREVWRVHDTTRSRLAAKRFDSKRAGHRVRAVGLLGLLVAVSPEGHSRREIEVLRPILRNGSVADIADGAREELLRRIRLLLDAEMARFVDRLGVTGLDPSIPGRLRIGAAWVTESAHALARRVGAEE